MMSLVPRALYIQMILGGYLLLILELLTTTLGAVHNCQHLN